jgi:asparagine synthetase B (glutamine-hydrolysing)
LIAVTAWFDGGDNPEAARAKQVASRLGIEDHHMVKVTGPFIRDFFPDLVRHLERPPTYFNAFAREAMFRRLADEVDAVVIGEGADGMFGDESAQVALRYNRKQRALRMVPWGIRRRLAGIVPNERVSYVLQNSAFDMVRGGHHFYAAYEPDTSDLVTFCQARNVYTSNRNQYHTYAMLADRHGLKVEFPFLMSGLAEIGLSLPNALKSDSRGAKPILKKLTCRYIPEEWVYASKMGFESPAKVWLDGALSEWRADLLEELDRRGIAGPSPKDHGRIWGAMGMEMFLRQFVDRASTAVPAAAHKRA